MAAETSVRLAGAKGDVEVRGPKEKSFSAARSGSDIADGSRLKTGDDGEAQLKFPDGTESTVRAKSEIIVRAVASGSKEPNAVILFFGRLWSHAAKASGAGESYEVRSANAVAGVRGTKFEVGVADDGSTRVIVTEGAVGVGGDDDKSGPVNVSSGYEIESNGEGRLAGSKKAAQDPDWDGWFSKRARELEKNGLAVARDLDGRLNERRAKLKRLVAEAKQYRQQIEQLEKQKKGGADVNAQLQETLGKLEKTTARLEDMKRRLEGAFGMFERWGDMANRGMMQGGGEMKKMVSDVQKMAAEFADMIEEGTDMSQEGMDDMMHDMKNTKPKKQKSAKDELF
jgi:ferric-dicitrate binding protein FerR (iron transport regulator)